MSTNNTNNDADSLFATRRKKQMEEEAEKERFLELERQKKEVAEKIKRLENIRLAQEEEARQKAEAEQRAAAERAESESQMSELDKRRAELAAKVSEPKPSTPIDSKKLMMFGLIGLGVIALVVIIIVVVKISSKDKPEDQFEEYSDGGDNDELYGDYDYDYGDYGEEEYTSAFVNMIQHGTWKSDEAFDSNGNFNYSYNFPAVFEKYEVENYPYGWFYGYYDAESEQTLGFEVWAYKGDASTIEKTINSLISDYVTEIAQSHVIETKIPHDYSVECMDPDADLWWANCGSIDDIQPGESIPVFFARANQDGVMIVCFNISHESENATRFISYTDGLVLFDNMFGSLSFVQAEG